MFSQSPLHRVQTLSVPSLSSFQYSYLYIAAIRCPSEPVRWAVPVTPQGLKMNGDGFTVLVSEGGKVKAGQKLMTFDISKIKAAGYSTTSAILLTNSDDYPSCNVVKTGAVKPMEKLIIVGE